LTSGSSHIVTATSRMETILKANRIPFKALDIATDEKARMLWGRRAGKDESGRPRKIPGLVQMGLVVGDLVEVEDWNEYGELKQHVKIVGNDNTIAPAKSAIPTPSGKPSEVPVLKENQKPEPVAESSKPAESAISLTLRQAGQEAAQKAKDSKNQPPKTFDGIGKAVPVKEVKEVKEEKEPEKLAAIPEPIDVPPKEVEKHTIDTISSLQSPTSSAWRPVDVNPPIFTHRGSSISAAQEEIKKVDGDQTIKEEIKEESEEGKD